MTAHTARSVAVALAVLVAGGVLAGVALGATGGGYVAQTGNETGNATGGNATEDAGGNATGDAGDGTAGVRVVHAAPDAPPVDVYVDGESVLTNLELGDVSDYLELAAGDHTVTVALADNQTELLSGTVTVEADTNYTVAAAGEAGDGANATLELATFVDDPPATDAGNASVRLVHLSPDAPAVDVTVKQTGDVLFDDVSYGNASDYVTVPAGRYTLELRPATADGNASVVAEFDVGLEDATAYSTFAVGYVDPGAAGVNATLDLVTGVDRAGPEVGVDDTEPMNVTVINVTSENLTETGDGAPNATANDTAVEA